MAKSHRHRLQELVATVINAFKLQDLEEKLTRERAENARKQKELQTKTDAEVQKQKQIEKRSRQQMQEHTEETERLKFLILALHKATNIQIKSLESSNSSSKTAILPGKPIKKIDDNFMVNGTAVQVRPSSESHKWYPGVVAQKRKLHYNPDVSETGKNTPRYVVWYVDETGAKRNIEVTGHRNQMLENDRLMTITKKKMSLQ